MCEVAVTKPAATKPTHIFMVDDEVAARELVGDYLTLQGFAVTLCEGGASLRQALAAHVPDLILLDLNIPEEDGLSIIRFVKQTTAVPVILLTATTSPIDRVVGLEMGADDYLTKPCELRELLARIRSVLRRVHWSTLRAGERRLAAILSLDQVGFSRALQRDEPATLSAIDRIFTEIVGPSLPRHRGILFKKTGDGALVEFASVVDAVEWAVGFQRALFDLPRMVLREAQIRFRVGIAIGDIVVAQGDRLGEGVALAVRVQEAGRPGTVTLSDDAHRLAGSRIEHRFSDLGLRPLKNIAEPMRLWEWSQPSVG
jgi:class 3 adenylate cyclase